MKSKQLTLKPFYTTGIASITQAEVLSADDVADLKNYMPELKQVFDTQTIWRTHTEAICSVLNDLKHPSRASKYHQAKLEQSVMFDNLITLSFDYREKLLDLQETEEKMKTAEGIELDRLEIQRERCIYSLDGMRRQAKQRLREVKMWSGIKKDLNNGSFDIDNKDTDELLALALRYCAELPAALRSKESAGAVNIFAQAQTLLRECHKQGIFEKLGPAGPNAEKLLSLW